MNKMIALVLILLILIGCESEKEKNARLTNLTCADSPLGRSHEEQQAIADACFKRGTFRKSSGQTW
jgi:entry exclusion lipoprotein TrbK